MNNLRAAIRKSLAKTVSPAVLCSFGKDSLLVLKLVREIIPNIPVLWYRTGVNEKFAKSVIAAWNLVVFSYAPADMYLLRCGPHTALVHEYSIGDARIPVVTDLEPGDPCVFHRDQPRIPRIHLPFDTLLVGWKQRDMHWVGQRRAFCGDIGGTKLFAPIAQLTDQDVWNANEYLDIPTPPVDDSLKLCGDCAEMLATSKDEGTLAAFRARYNLESLEN